MTSTKKINTRIQNKVDVLENWQASKSVLLNGEIAITRVKTSEKYNPINGQTEPEWELLMKVGDGVHTFTDSALPWLSAKAADVYDWAKNKNIEDVTVKVKCGEDTDDTEDSLTAWLKTVYDKGVANSGRLDEHDEIFAELLGDDGDAGNIKDWITAAIDALNTADEQTTTDARADHAIVKAVTQSKGIVTVTYGTIREDELPSIHANKIIVKDAVGTAGQDGYTEPVTLDAKLSKIDGRLDAAEDILEGVVDSDNNIATVVDYVEAKLGALDLDSSSTNLITNDTNAATRFVTAIKQEDGQVSYTTHILHEAVDGETTKGIVAIGVANGAASHNAIFGENGLKSEVTSNKSEIDEIRGLIAGGVHFRGITTTELTDGATTATIKLIDGNSEKNYTLTETNAGDVVIYRENIGTENEPVYRTEREFIWTGTFWEELGDLTRLGALENLTNSLATAPKNAEEDHKFVTHITKETDGTYTVNKAQPTSEDVSHDTDGSFTDGTVGAELVNHAGRLDSLETTVDLEDQTVSEAIDSAIQKLTFEAPTATDDANNPIEFIDSVTLDNSDNSTRGVVTLTKKRIREATTNTSGIVQLTNSVNSESTTTAATPSAVKTAYDVATNAQSRVEAVEDNYVKFVPLTDGNGNVLNDGSRGTLRVGAADTDITLIFDCGGALDMVYFSAETSTDNFKAYTAIEGMTWSEWVASEYNETLPGGTSFYEYNGKIYSPADSVVDVTPDTVIIATRYLIKR